MYKNEKMFTCEISQESFNKEPKKPKRVEWLNVYSKGFLVESINNNYINKNIPIKKHDRKTKKDKNIILRNTNSLIYKREIEPNKSILGNSGSSSRKTNFSCMIDDEEDYNSQKMSLITQLNNILSHTTKKDSDNKKKEEIKKIKKINIKNKNKIKTYKNIKNKQRKLAKCNSSKNMKIAKEEENVILNKLNRNNNNNKHRCGSVRPKVNISLKKNICSPLLNYLEFRYINLNQSFFNSMHNNNINNINNNKDNKNKDNNTIINRNNNIDTLDGISKTLKYENKNIINNINNDFTNINSSAYNNENGNNQKENNKIYNNISKNDNDKNNKTEIKKKKKNLYRYSKSIKEITINNVNIIEIQKYMIDGRKYKHDKNKNKNNRLFNDYKNDLGDYTFDNDEEDEDINLAITERKNVMSFSELCNPSDIYMTNKKAANKLYV